MKRILLLPLILLTLLSSCQNLNLINSQFGKTTEQVTIAIFPDANNFYQDINGGGSRLGNETLAIIGTDSIKLFSPADAGLPMDSVKYPDLLWTWSLNDSVVSHLENPRLIDIIPTHSGVQWLQITIYHKSTGATFSRGKWAYFQYNAHQIRDENGILLDNGVITAAEAYVPAGTSRPGLFGVFVPFVSFKDDWLKWTRMDNDLNNDGIFSSSDLTLILSQLN